ncbi:MAG: hypothetical protein LUC34_02180 [Campylobacter sp.]|nr:hypothetical protein [Campylobacter sp.]
MLSINELKLANQTLEALQWLLNELSEIESLVKEIKNSNGGGDVTSDSIILKMNEISAKIDEQQQRLTNDLNAFETKRAELNTLNAQSYDLLTQAQNLLKNADIYENLKKSQALFSELESLKEQLAQSIKDNDTTNLKNELSANLAQAKSDLNASIDTKLGKADTAQNSTKLNNVTADKYALKTDIKTYDLSPYAKMTDVNTALNNKLDKTAQAGDSAKLGGLAASSYLTKTDTGIANNASPLLSNIDSFDTPTGFYRVSHADTAGTLPPTFKERQLHGFLIVERIDSNWIKQTLTSFADSSRIWVRANSAIGVWGDWEYIHTNRILNKNSLVVDLNLADNFELTPGDNGVLTLQNGIRGQSGVIIINGADTKITGYAPNLIFNKVPTGLDKAQAFSYFVLSNTHIIMRKV